MRVVVITTKAEGYHRYLCAAMAKRHELVGVLHPGDRSGDRAYWRKKNAEDRRKWGLLHHLLRKLQNNRFRNFGWQAGPDIAQAEARHMPDADADYDRLAAPVAREVADVNGEEGIAAIRELGPEAVVCSGGPIYREPLIRAAGLMLNFHTGVSPLYNGAGTIFWTYANGQPHITGGTLMHMSPVVDGGDILAHFLPSVEAGDTPGDQFVKTIIGGADLYADFLDHVASGRSFVAAPQGRPFHLYFGYQWTVYQTLAIQRHVERDICGRHVRDAIRRTYWQLPSREAAIAATRDTLADLVYNVQA